MARGANQKLKLLYLADVFREQTDEYHGLSAARIISLLEARDVSVERKTLYEDIRILQDYGMDIVSEQDGRTVIYKLISREFELPELKLLVDSVQASRFITERKSRELIKKLESLTSVNEAHQLHRQLVLSGRVKTMNESIYYSVDKIHSAIIDNRQISFQYFQWNPERKPELRHGGAVYKVSPWSLIWADNNYYLLAYDSESGIMKHYRVDKMLKINLLDAKREGKKMFEKLDMAGYSNSVFGMFGGESESVTLLCENSLAGAVIDRFGKDAVIIREDDKSFRAVVKAALSQQFFGWVIALGEGVRITAPEKAVDEMRRIGERLTGQYQQR